VHSMALFSRPALPVRTAAFPAVRETDQLRSELVALLSELSQACSSSLDEDGSQRLVPRALHWMEAVIAAAGAGGRPVLSP
jgi:Mor family transcriptional regulator